MLLPLLLPPSMSLTPACTVECCFGRNMGHIYALIYAKYASFWCISTDLGRFVSQNEVFSSLQVTAELSLPPAPCHDSYDGAQLRLGLRQQVGIAERCSKNVIQREQFEVSNKQVTWVRMSVPKPDVCGTIFVDLWISR